MAELTQLPVEILRQIVLHLDNSYNHSRDLSLLQLMRVSIILRDTVLSVHYQTDTTAWPIEQRRQKIKHLLTIEAMKRWE